MEHRYGQRLKSHLQVMIYERGMPVSTGITINSSRHGLFIETNHQAVHNQRLEIEIIDRARRSGMLSTVQNRRMKCFVVHAQANGFGVEIDDTHVNEFSAITAMRAFASDYEMPMVMQQANA